LKEGVDMGNIRVKGHVDNNHHLTAQVPAEVGPGEVELILVFSPHDEAAAEEQWADAVSREWAAEWNDPREDIYTITDGEPVDGSR
jgi:hypothetical protein